MVSSTYRIAIADPWHLMAHGWQIADTAPETAAKSGFRQAYGMSPYTALALLLAETAIEEIAARPGDFGLRLDAVAVTATSDRDGAVLHEVHTGRLP